MCREQWIYKVSAIAASLGVTSLAVVAVYYRFAWHMDSSGGDFPWVEAAATLALTIGGAVRMESVFFRWTLHRLVIPVCHFNFSDAFVKVCLQVHCDQSIYHGGLLSFKVIDGLYFVVNSARKHSMSWQMCVLVLSTQPATLDLLGTSG